MSYRCLKGVIFDSIPLDIESTVLIIDSSLPVSSLDTGQIVTANCDELPGKFSSRDVSCYFKSYLPIDSAFENIYNSLFVFDIVESRV
jgi:hypothetical protein